MLFYADGSQEISVAAAVDRVAADLSSAAAVYRRLPASPTRAALEAHAGLVGAAIALGELHQAVSDHLNPDSDDTFPDLDRLARAGVLVGRCVYRSACLARSSSLPSSRYVPVPGQAHPHRTGFPRALRVGDRDSIEMAKMLDSAARAVARAAPPGLPPRLEARVPEGFAFYCLYPEMYFASLARAIESSPDVRSYMVVGIRSIGTSLATMVAGALVEQGFDVAVETLRPRGHPFDRNVALAPPLRTRLARRRGAGAGFIVVDEGPGLTCSSFLSVCSALAELGVSEDRISILSAWAGAPSIYASDEARARWKRLRVFHTSAAEAFDGWRAFVPFLLQARSPLPPAEGPSLPADLILLDAHDLSYGRWREWLIPTPESWPVVHRAMERVKVLYRFGPPAAGNADRSGLTSQPSVLLLAKFAGLGDCGRQKLERAEALAEAGLAPPVLGLAYGFLIHPFLARARPLSVSDLSSLLLARMVEYYAFLARRFARPPSPRFNRLSELVLVNSRKGLGLDASDFVAAWSPWRETIDALPLVQVDGRPQPHEWLETTDGEATRFLKADSSDHFRDHTLVGDQSVLWDLAASCEEWGMDGRWANRLLDLWERTTGDRQARPLLDFYRAAYLAFRVAALHYAVHSTDEDDIRESLQHQEWGYRQRLRQRLSALPESPDRAGWNGTCGSRTKSPRLVSDV